MSLSRRVLARILWAVTVAGFVAACSVPTTYRWEWQEWDPSKLGYAAGKGAILTDIRGNPFNQPKEQVDAAITEAMFGAHFGPDVPFVTEEPQDYNSPYRVLIVFDPDVSLTPEKLCAEDPKPGERSEGVIKVVAAFCAQDIHETSVWGSVGQTSGPESEEFQSLVKIMTNQLFPRQNPNERDNDNIWIIGG